MLKNINKLLLLSLILTLLLASASYAVAENDDSSQVSIDESSVNDYSSIQSTDNMQSYQTDNNNMSSQQKSDDMLVSGNTNKNKKNDENIIQISNQNIENYFDVDDIYLTPKSDKISSNQIIEIQEQLNSPHSWLFEGELSNITFTAKDTNINLVNQAFEIYIDNFTLCNLSLEYTPNFPIDKAIYIDAPYFKFINSHVIYDADILGSNLNALLVLLGEHSLVENSTFNCFMKSTEVDWNPFTQSDFSSLPQSVPVLVAGNYSDIKNINLTVNEKASDGSTFPSFYGIAVSASYVNITESNINLTGRNGYVYTIYLTDTFNKMNNVTISDNNITGKSEHNYTAGVYMDGANYQNNTVKNNNINVSCGVELKENDYLQDVVYAVVITDRGYMGGAYKEGKGNVTNNSVINNTITGQGHQIYGFEQFGGDNTILESNTINLTGSRTQGMGIIGYNTVVSNNSISVVGDSNQTESSPDYLPPYTAGIQLIHGSNTLVENNDINSTGGRAIIINLDSNNTIVDNNITANGYDYSIEFLKNATGNYISNNQLSSSLANGSESIYGADESNIVEDNDEPVNIINTHLFIDDLNATLNDEIELFAWIQTDDSNEETLDGQKINIYIDGNLIAQETLTSSAIVYPIIVNQSWYKKEVLVLVEFEGYDVYNASSASKVVKFNIPTSINTSTVNETMPIGSQISANVLDIMDNAVDADMQVYINNQYVGNYSSYVFNITQPGEYTVKYLFDQKTLDDEYTYNACGKTLTFTVEPIATQVVFNDLTVNENALTNISVNVMTDDESVIINEGIVEFIDSNGNILQSVNVINGVASVNLTFNQIGENTIRAEFKNSAVFSNSYDEAIITVVKESKKQTTIVINPVEYSYGEAINITANITDSNANVVDGGKVFFKINGKVLKDNNNKIIYVGVHNGTATLSYDIDVNLLKSSNNITATYSGTSKYASSKSQNTPIIQSNSTINLSLPTLNAKNNQSLTITANITKNQKAVTTGKVVFKVNGKTLKDANGKVIYAKVVNGQAIVNYTFDDSFKEAQYNLTAVYISLEDKIQTSSVLTIAKV